jgi:hypothetical protein
MTEQPLIKADKLTAPADDSPSTITNTSNESPGTASDEQQNLFVDEQPGTAYQARAETRGRKKTLSPAEADRREKERKKKYRERLRQKAQAEGVSYTDASKGGLGGKPEATPDEPDAEYIRASAATLNIPPEAYAATATMIVGTMDMLLSAISENEYRAPDELRENYKLAWSNYLKSTGKEPPAWLMLSIMSFAYCAPALNTAPAKSKFDRATSRIKAWFHARKGGVK